MEQERSNLQITHTVGQDFPVKWQRKRLSCIIGRQDPPPPLSGSETAKAEGPAMCQNLSSQFQLPPGTFFPGEQNFYATMSCVCGLYV